MLSKCSASARKSHNAGGLNCLPEAQRKICWQLIAARPTSQAAQHTQRWPIARILAQFSLLAAGSL